MGFRNDAEPGETGRDFGDAPGQGAVAHGFAIDDDGGLVLDRRA
jgi:hypothetical protein